MIIRGDIINDVYSTPARMITNTINDAVTMPGGEGTLLAGRYRIVRQLGQGGMGSVWLAEDTQLDNKLFAIKMLPSILVCNKRAYRQLKDEALVAMKLTHTNIVTLRAFEENNGNPFLVMDYIDGQTLDDYLAEKGKLSEGETIKLLKPIALALDYAHGEGVVHRDVKPANVMLRKDGHPFILDFGISREMQETMTRVTGKLSSGTLLYMSPEQLRGLPPKPAQDVYSFAAMAYECMSGHPPFYRGAIEDQIKNEQPEPLEPHIIIRGPVSQGLSKNPEARPSNCAAVVDGNSSRGPVESRRKAGASSSNFNTIHREVENNIEGGVGLGYVLAVGSAILLVAALAIWWGTGGSEKIELVRRTGVSEASSTTNVVDAPLPPISISDSTEDQVVDIKVEASVAKGRLNRIPDDDGFRKKKNALADDFERAEGFYKVNQWGRAAVGYTNFVEACKSLASLSEARDEAKTSREAAAQGKESAKEFGAERYAFVRWKSSVELMDAANQLFDDMSFVEAKRKFDMAAKQFNTAMTEAKTEHDRQVAEQKRKEQEAVAELERKSKEDAYRKAAEQKAETERAAEENRMKIQPFVGKWEGENTIHVNDSRIGQIKSVNTLNYDFFQDGRVDICGCVKYSDKSTSVEIKSLWSLVDGGKILELKQEEPVVTVGSNISRYNVRWIDKDTLELRAIFETCSDKDIGNGNGVTKTAFYDDNGNYHSIVKGKKILWIQNTIESITSPYLLKRVQ